MKGMSPIVKTITRLAVPPVLLFGFYLFLHGHISHGAGFAGGVIIAIALSLILLAFGREELERRVNLQRALFIATVMIYFLAALAVIGFLSTTGFAGNFLQLGKPFALFSSGTVIIANAALCLITAGSLLTIFMSLLSLGDRDHGRDPGEDKQ